MKRITIGFIFTLLAGSAMSQSISKYADSVREKYHVPEMAFAVITPHGITIKQVIGYHKTNTTDRKDAANINDYFHLGSNTKAITGFIAAYLVEQGKIQWNTKLFDLYPDWKAVANPAYYDITLQDLLSHRAHIKAYTAGADFTTLPAFTGDTAQCRKQFAAYLLTLEPVNTPTGFSYSNAGYSIAACMLEKATGETWEQLVMDILHKKLGLNVRFGWPNLADPNQPWGHWDENGQLTALPGNITYNLHLIEPAGDISIPITDYAKFIQLNLDGLNGKNNLLKADTYNFLHYGIKDYAIGWANVNTEARKFSNHAGSAGTFYCITQVEPNAKTAYIVMANSATAGAQLAITDLLKKLRSVYN